MAFDAPAMTALPSCASGALTNGAATTRRTLSSFFMAVTIAVPTPHDRLQTATAGQEMAAGLDRRESLRGRYRSVARQVLRPRDVRVSLGPRARGTRPQLHHRRRHGPREAAA